MYKGKHLSHKLSATKPGSEGNATQAKGSLEVGFIFIEGQT